MLGRSLGNGEATERGEASPALQGVAERSGEPLDDLSVLPARETAAERVAAPGNFGIFLETTAVKFLKQNFISP
jgi:hypothetical protein